MSHAFIDDCLKNIDDCTVNYSCESKTITKILLAYRSQFITTSKSEDDFVYCTLPYVHSAIEDVGVDKLFKHKEILSLLPLSTSECSIRTSFSYGPTIGRKLFNYNTVLTDLSNRDLRKLKCDCDSKYADFVYQPHGHVHTGHLGIIQCEPLRWVMGKGAKFRLKPRINIPGEDMKYKIRTGKSHLHDGCHPSLSIKREWNFHMSAVKTVNRLQLSSPEAVKIIDEASHHRCDLTGVPIEKSTFKFKLSDFNTRSYSSNYSRHHSRRY